MSKNPTIERDMMSKPFYEVEKMIKETENDLSISNFATISAIKGKQFGREIFSSVLQFKDLVDFLQVFPEVQRDIIPRRVSKIKNYILSGIENKDNMRFFSGITVTARGNLFYDETTKKIAIDTNKSKLSINDGQNRFYGISEAIRDLQGRINKGRDEVTRQQLREYIEELKYMVIPLVIFNNISEREEKQLFFDLNNLAQRPSRSATIRLAQTDLFSKLAREMAQENKYLVHYGVEYNKMSIHDNNPNTILLTTVYAMIKQLFYREYKADYNFLNEWNYSEYKKITLNTLDELFYILPPDINIKGKYVIEKSYTLKGICKFIHYARNDLKLEEKQIFDAIKKVNWTTNLQYWSIYGAFPSKKGLIQFSGNGEGGIMSVFTACLENLNKPNKKELLEKYEQENAV